MKLNYKILIINLVLFIFVSIAVQYYTIKKVGEPSFPIDDAWCYTAYSRNIYNGYGFIYNKYDIYSSLPIGATALSWPIVLVPAPLLNIDYITFALFSSYFFAALSIMLTYFISLLIFNNTFIAFFTSFLLSLSKFFSWTAGSGMSESFLSFVVLSGLFFFIKYYHSKKKYLSYIFFSSAAFIRPDAILIFFLIMLFDLLFVQCNIKKKIFQTIIISAIFLLFFIPYSLINYLNWLDTNAAELATFSAVSYYEVGQSPYLKNLTSNYNIISYVQHVLKVMPWRFESITNFYLKENLWIFFTGIFSLFYFRKYKFKKIFIRLLFTIGFLFPYIRGHLLDILSGGQYDRYFHPLLPIIYIISAPILFQLNLFSIFCLLLFSLKYYFFSVKLYELGILFIILFIINKFNFNKKISRKKIILISVIFTFISLLYFYKGLLNYSSSVYGTYNLQDAVGKWLNKNTPPNSKIATFDKEAINYYSDRLIISLGGRTTPELIKYFRSWDEKALNRYMKNRKIGYFIGNPEFYPYLTSQKTFKQIKKFQVPANPNIFVNPMIIYKTGYDKK